MKIEDQMEAWITADELIDKGVLSEINFIYLVDEGKITPFNKHTFQKIDLDLWKTNFTEIQEHFVKFQRSDEFKISEMDFSHDEQEWTSWKKIHTALAAWETMGKSEPDLLIDAFKDIFTYDQYIQISNGWNNNIVRRIISESVFKKTEVLTAVNKIYPKDICGGEEEDTPQQTKNRNTLLKIIGGFIQIKYLHPTRSKTTYMNGDKPNATAIANTFYQDLINAGIGDEGMKNRTLREIIPEALEAIQQNKIGAVEEK